MQNKQIYIIIYGNYLPHMVNFNSGKKKIYSLYDATKKEFIEGPYMNFSNNTAS